ncbi:U-box domain-containing protein kinase family protein [Euphorbia peplus]|nr:U-box domain-containing protein kinase family protein [Euphorbia peplus]
MAAETSSSSSSRSRSLEDTVYVAVGIDYEESKLNLLWAIENFPAKSLCILHVHRPAKIIHLVGGKFSASRLEQHELRKFEDVERRIMERIMDDYLLLCVQVEVHAEKICVETDDIGKGIVELIYQHDVKKLVMGAAANKHYSEEMMDLKSMKAKYVQHRAPHSCQIYYTCHGYHIYTWEGDSTSSSTNGFRDPAYIMQQRTEGSAVGRELCEVLQTEEESDNFDASEGSNIDQLYAQLERAFLEAEKFKQEAYEESRKRSEAEMKANKTLCRAQALQNLYAKELRCRKETEEALAREKEEHQRTKNKREEERLVTLDQRLLQQIQASDFASKMEELKDERLSAVHQCEEYKKERDRLLEEHEDLRQLAQAIQLSKEGENGSCSNTNQSLLSFSYSEIEEATCGFDLLLRIGETRHGNVYKAVIRHIPVAIKMMTWRSTMGKQAFQQEVDTMSKLRHPNVANLIGVCNEDCALIYEYVENGSLEDRLKCKGNTPPLPWLTRINIASELCSVLSFLHSFSPHTIVHGDLTSANILLDSNFSCKLSGFGTCRLSPLRENLRDVLLDPHFLETGESSPKSDIYSFGVVLLQLLTGWSSVSDSMKIRDVIDEGNFDAPVDDLAGDWPVEQARHLAHLGLSCCALDSTIRPDLESGVWTVLESMRASCSVSDQLDSSENENPPTYFVCPILQEVMEDPHVAADGYTYEGEALRDWLASGHNTSPMTNLELRHLNLIPNYSLRSAIIEWKEQQH